MTNELNKGGKRVILWLAAAASLGLVTASAMASCPSAWSTSWDANTNCTDNYTGTTVWSGTDTSPRQLHVSCSGNSCAHGLKGRAIGATSSGSFVCGVETYGPTQSTTCSSAAVKHRSDIIRID